MSSASCSAEKIPDKPLALDPSQTAFLRLETLLAQHNHSPDSVSIEHLQREFISTAPSLSREQIISLALNVSYAPPAPARASVDTTSVDPQAANDLSTFDSVDSLALVDSDSVVAKSPSESSSERRLRFLEVLLERHNRSPGSVPVSKLHKDFTAVAADLDKTQLVEFAAKLFTMKPFPVHHVPSIVPIPHAQASEFVGYGSHLPSSPPPESDRKSTREN